MSAHHEGHEVHEGPFSETCKWLASRSHALRGNAYKRVFDLMKDFGTSKSTKIDSIFDSLLVPR
ncbi:MAG: hypothetical protein ABW095_01205, partial [Candidatus Thiodiazotropha sp.]